jgi:ferric-dicitrate binding protein FerR (iron transport regulator)
MKTPEEIAQLLFRHTSHELKPEEELELARWRAMSAENEQVFRDANDPEYIRREMQFIHETRDRVYKKIMEYPLAEAVRKVLPPRIYKIMRVAAVLVFSLGSLYIVLTTNIGGSPSGLHPSGNYHAEIINPEGIASAVDDVKRGYADGYAAARRRRSKNKEPFFTASNDPEAAAGQYNTFRTPEGAQYGLLLPDSTRIWLNGGTSVKYPARFSPGSGVTITGEVYIELKAGRDARTPFHVSAGNTRLTATQGRFNLKATADSVIVTAIDGDLLLDTASAAPPVLLHSREQAQLTAGQLHTLKDIDTSKILAWKNDAGKP